MRHGRNVGSGHRKFSPARAPYPALPLKSPAAAPRPQRELSPLPRPASHLTYEPDLPVLPAGAEGSISFVSERDRPVVLVADDDPDILELVRFWLERAGYEVVQARNGEEALQIATENPPDVAVLDVMMPKLSGYDVTRQLRRQDRTSEIPVILLTARVQEADVARGFESGADDYLKKPFSPRELSARVRAILGRR